MVQPIFPGALMPQMLTAAVYRRSWLTFFPHNKLNNNKNCKNALDESHVNCPETVIFSLRERGRGVQSDRFLRRMIPLRLGYSPMMLLSCHYLRTPPAASGPAYRLAASRADFCRWHLVQSVQRFVSSLPPTELKCNSLSSSLSQRSTTRHHRVWHGPGVPEPDMTLEGKHVHCH